MTAEQRELEVMIREYKSAERKGEPHHVLYSIYKKIKELKHRITLSQPHLQKIMNAVYL